MNANLNVEHTLDRLPGETGAFLDAMPIAIVIGGPGLIDFIADCNLPSRQD